MDLSQSSGEEKSNEKYVFWGKSKFDFASLSELILKSRNEAMYSVISDAEHIQCDKNDIPTFE